MVNVKKNEKGRIFKNSLLEWLTKTNPYIHIVTYGSLIWGCLYLNTTDSKTTALLFGTGVVVWTLKEYLIHRYVFHIRFPRLQYIIHGIHHEYPKDKERLLMPPVPGLILFLILSGFWFLLIGEYLFAFMAGITTGYLFYTFMHYIIHAFKPIRPFKFIWSHHLRHHNPRFEDKAFGVSTPIWDWIFGTLPARD